MFVISQKMHPLKKLKRGQKTEFPSTIHKPKLICVEDTKETHECVCVHALVSERGGERNARMGKDINFKNVCTKKTFA